MFRSLSVGLLFSAMAFAPIQLRADETTARNLGGVMSISLQDLIKTTIADKCALKVANSGSGDFSWVAYTHSDVANGNNGKSLAYDDVYEKRFSADFSWRFDADSSIDRANSRTSFSDDYPLSGSNNFEASDHTLSACFAGVKQPALLPPLQLPLLQEGQ